jgi:hypothetical protein
MIYSIGVSVCVSLASSDDMHSVNNGSILFILPIFACNVRQFECSRHCSAVFWPFSPSNIVFALVRINRFELSKEQVLLALSTTCCLLLWSVEFLEF